MKVVYVHSFRTRFGTIHTASTDDGLALVTLPGDSEGRFHTIVRKHFPDSIVEPGGPESEQVERQLLAYSEGKLKKFTLKLDLIGSSFQKRVLTEVARIPYGQTRTYREIAAAVGNPKASRAVGGANAHNPIPLVVPCHRVVAANGLGGYGGGLTMKKKLLALEGALQAGE
ncbi:MAG: methylated-DNA--[protein]-cysteine S-methyltransferase [Candidatus Zixiibacteriota bacterium]